MTKIIGTGSEVDQFTYDEMVEMILSDAARHIWKLGASDIEASINIGRTNIEIIYKSIKHKPKRRLYLVKGN